MNSVQLIGNLVKEPELRYGKSGKEVGNFTIAVNNPFNKDDTAFLKIISFGKVAENSANYLNKGSKVGVVGRLQTRNYENKEGQKVYVTEIIANEVEFLDTKKDKAERKEEPKEIDTSDVDLDEFEMVDDSEIPF